MSDYNKKWRDETVALNAKGLHEFTLFWHVDLDDTSMTIIGKEIQTVDKETGTFIVDGVKFRVGNEAELHTDFWLER